MLFPWGDGRPYHSYAAYCRRVFGGPVRKLPVDGGFTCPNRDGTLGRGGCAFCDNAAFAPRYCDRRLTVAEQLDAGIAFYRSRGRRAERCLAYFQSFSNTYAPLDRLRRLYDGALAHPAVCGLAVSTRPDCVDGRRLDLLADRARGRYVCLELGVESLSDEALGAVNRGHGFAASERAVRAAADRGLAVAAHLIVGLPGDATPPEALAGALNALPLALVKFHQLQLFDGTELARRHAARPWPLLSEEEYAGYLEATLRRLRPDIAVERLSGEVPPRYLAVRPWRESAGPFAFRFERRLAARGVRQGDLWSPF